MLLAWHGMYFTIVVTHMCTIIPQPGGNNCTSYECEVYIFKRIFKPLTQDQTNFRCVYKKMCIYWLLRLHSTGQVFAQLFAQSQARRTKASMDIDGQNYIRICSSHVNGSKLIGTNFYLDKNLKYCKSMKLWVMFQKYQKSCF